MAPSQRKWLGRLGLVLGSVVLALGAGEVVLRWVHPREALVQAGTEWQGWRQNSDVFKTIFTTDPELGFRPLLGTRHFDAHGCDLSLGSYPLKKTAGRRRCLFLGDSVTARRAIEKAFRRHYGEQAVEYWNAGVEGYNTRQEVTYFRRYNIHVDPDHVILTFHNNDFGVTPVAYYDDQDRIVVVEPDQPVRAINPWLYRHCYLYRAWFDHGTRGASRYDIEAGARTVRQALQELKALVAGRNARLTVLVLPPCKPWVEWTDQEKDHHRRALRILGDLEIPHVDLLPALEAALREGIDVQERKGDAWHPSAAAGQAFLQHMRAQGFDL